MQSHVFTVPAHMSSPARARAIIGVLDGKIEPQLLADLRLVVSELVAAAVRYGPGEPIPVALWVDGRTRVEGEVGDAAAIEGPGAGLGLRIVQRLTTAWEIREGGRVWFELTA